MDIPEFGNEKTSAEKTPEGDAAAPSPRLSRRDLLAGAGRGVTGLAAALALVSALGEAAAASARPRTRLERMLPGARELTGAAAQAGRGAASALTQPVPAPEVLQLPFWGDAAAWNRPEYYETIQAGRRFYARTVQSADVDGDGQDELLARGPGGILVNRFDPDTGQWFLLPGSGPALNDAQGWTSDHYYLTIQTADIDGDGRAEIIARDAGGIVAHKYDPASGTWGLLPNGPAWSDVSGWTDYSRFLTIQCADIDGDGRAELLARDADGIVAHRYDPVGRVWTKMARGPAWNNDSGWTHDKYYATIQTADIDGDGRAELLARDAGGIVAYKYDPATDSWELMPAGPGWSDTSGWDGPQYFMTIQCADIDGDGRAEVVARDAGGIVAWKYAPGSKSWKQLARGPAWKDQLGWPGEFTIQCADVDGDGRAELFARATDGIVAYKYDPGSDSWNPLPDGPAWSSTAHWDRIEYYTTIQTARVSGSAINPHNPPSPAGGKIAALIGRSASAVQTWRFVGPAGAQPWLRTSAPFPAFTGDRLKAYDALTTHWQLVGGGVRHHYNNVQGDFSTLASALYSSDDPPYSPSPPGAPLLPAPAGVSDEDWAAVSWQLFWELNFVDSVHAWYGADGVEGLINFVFLSDAINVGTVNDYISLPSNSNAKVALNILSIVANAFKSLMGFSLLAIPEAGGIAGVLGTAFSAAGGFLPGDGSTQVAFVELQNRLDTSFNAAVSANGQNQLAITGGVPASGAPYVAGDWGLLSAIGQQKKYGLWEWPADADTFVGVPLQRQYALSIWQTLVPLLWHVEYGSVFGPPIDYPGGDRYLYHRPGGTHPGDTFWMNTSYALNRYPARNTLAALFDSPITDADVSGAPPPVHPLGVPLADPHEGSNGWPRLNRVDIDVLKSAGPGRPQLPSLAPDLWVSDVVLTRETATGDIVASFALTNRGLAGASNVKLTQARLRNLQAPDGVHLRHVHLAAGQARAVSVRFPADTGDAGESVVLRLSGRHADGTFGDSVRVRLP
ncbi:MAG TPA: FG-GAP-like repeat-containing protein [Armatimonadaceae bacterium]|nr:FG-GAP-like repeat-containing protein [Armatimonadaceae bacterium]